MCLCRCIACCCSSTTTSSSSSAFSKADVPFITGVWQHWAEWTSVCHPLMGLGSLQGVHNTSERVAFSFCLPRRRKRPITLPSHVQSTVQFHFTSASVPRIGSGTYGQIQRPVDLMGIDRTLPGSHTVLALIPLQLSIAIYSLEVRLSNPFWVNPAFWCRPIDPLSAVLLLIYLCWANVFIWWIPRQTHIKAMGHHLIRFHWTQIGKRGFGIVMWGLHVAYTQCRQETIEDRILVKAPVDRSPILSCV